VRLAIISEADHSFQEVPVDMDMRYKERMSLESFKRPYRNEYFRGIEGFLLIGSVRKSAGLGLLTPLIKKAIF